MKARILIVLALPALPATALWAEDAKEEKEFSAVCPVSGQPAKEDAVVMVRGKKVYFCCQNCPKAYKADKEKFAAKVHHQLASTGQIVQVACPFTGGPTKAETAIDVAGVKVAFCCENCQGKAEKTEGDERVALVFGSIDKGFTLQTACPVSDKPIDPAVSVEHEGKKVYFCCPGCPDAFKADPDKFLAKLPQFAEEEAE